MKKHFDVLRKCPLFDQIADEQLTALLGCLNTTVVHYDKKETIIAEGDAANHIGIVLSGAVQIMQVDYFGNRSIVGSAQPSEMFGESFACADVKAIPVNVVANADSDILLIDRDKIMYSCCKHCDFHQQMIFNLMRNMATKNILFHQKLEITAKRTTREKLMAYLLVQAKKANNSRFHIPFDRQELADYLEVDRSGLSAEIGKMRKEGILNSKKQYFELLQV